MEPLIPTKDIPGYEGEYAITSDGRVYSYPRLKRTGGWQGGYRVPFENTRGYMQIGLYDKLLGARKRKKFLIHRLVAAAFLPNPNNFAQVHHKDFNPHNNNVTNLEWCDNDTNQHYNVLRRHEYSYGN